MYKLIAANADLLLEDKRLRKGVGTYATLIEQLYSVDVGRDEHFQRRYRAFWGLNPARLGEEWSSIYFGILEREKRSAPPKLKSVVSELRNRAGRDFLHVSFASKLVHMLDPNRPVFDSLVAGAYFFQRPINKSPDYRLQCLLRFCDFLDVEYARAVGSGFLVPAFSKFRSSFPESARFTEVRILDFLMWTCVRKLRQGAQLNGKLLYELA